MEIQTDVTQPAAPPEAKRRGGARPGAGRPSTREAKAPKNEPFILPKLRRTHGTHQFTDFVKWWLSLTDEQLDKLIVYVYRSFPVCDVKQVDPDQDSNIEKLTGPCPFTEDNWRTEIMGKWGSGSYTFMIKEGAIKRWNVYAADLRDYQNFPPQIDYGTLMLSDPANRDFIKWARSRNLIETPAKEGTEDMAAITELVTQSMDRNDRLTERILNMQERLQDKDDKPEGHTNFAEMKGMELMHEASKEAIGLMRETLREQNTAQTQSANPLEMLDRVVSVAQTIAGARTDPGESAIVGLMRDQIQAQREELTEQRRLVMDLLTRKSSPAEDGERPAGIMGKLQEHLENKLLDELTGKKDSAGEDEESATKAGKNGVMAMVVEGLMRNAPALIGQGGLNGLVTNLINGAITLRSMPAGGFPAPAAGTPGTPGTPVPPQVLPQQPAPPPDPMVNFIRNLSDPLLHHMTSDILDGHTFARWFIDSSREGRENYMQLQAAGLDGIKQGLQLWPPLWERVSRMPDQLDKFIAEFLEFDAWDKRMSEEEDEDDETPPAPGVH